jgi:hypothetical protein
LGTESIEIGAFVIGTPGSLRNPQLELAIGKGATFVPPVFLGKNHRAPLRALVREFILNGRLLTNGERGCARAHILVRDAITLSRYEWALVVEDDAELPREWRAQLSRIFDLSTLEPSVVLLSGDAANSLEVGLHPLKIKPSGAYAFLVHRSLLEARPFKNMERFEVADWPISFSKMRFFVLGHFAREGVSESLIGQRPVHIIPFYAGVALRLMGLPIASLVTGVSSRLLFNWTLLAPVKRDLVTRLRAANQLLRSKLAKLAEK